MVNGLVLVAPVAVLLTIVVVSAQHTALWTVVLIAVVLAISVVVARVLYELAVRASIDRWGPLVRAALDLHLLDLYDRLAVRRPSTPAEDLRVGKAVDARLVYGTLLDDDVRVEPPA